MEFFKENPRTGVIGFKSYEKMLEIVFHLEQNENRFESSVSRDS